jgi:hypothetical protein
VTAAATRSRREGSSVSGDVEGMVMVLLLRWTFPKKASQAASVARIERERHRVARDAP